MGFKPVVVFVWEEGGGHASQLPSFGGFPVDPGFGVPAPGHPSHPIAHPGGGLRPDNSLPAPPPQGVEINPLPIPPGQELPALPKGAAVLVWIPGKGWVAIPLNPGKPDQSLPEGPPDRPDQGLPPTATPKRF